MSATTAANISLKQAEVELEKQLGELQKEVENLSNTLDKLTYILGKAQSEAFVSVQKEQKRNIIQKFINDVQILLCPIRTDNDLLTLLLITDMDVENAIQTILDEVSLHEIVSSEAVDKRQCVLQKRMHMPKVTENVCIFDAKNADEYMIKIALSRLANAFYQIANW